jgi:hypothetical protein
MKKLTHATLSLGFGFLGCSILLSPLMAQGQLNTYFSVGTMIDSSNGQQISPLGLGTFGTPRMTGTFPGFGASYMFTPHFGVGGEFNWRASQGDYSGVNYRPLFYDFNGVWQPIKAGRFVPEIQAGMGAAAVHFNANSTNCDPLVGCSSVNLGSESSNHFQTHLGVAARFYATKHIFIRPAADVHWVNDFFQFGSNWVPEYSIGLGYSIGGTE